MMEEHVKIFRNFFGIADQVPQLSAISGDFGPDIHHIVPRGRGGGNEITNLIALTRQEHARAHGTVLPRLTVGELQTAQRRAIQELLRETGKRFEDWDGQNWTD